MGRHHLPILGISTTSAAMNELLSLPCLWSKDPDLRYLAQVSGSSHSKTKHPWTCTWTALALRKVKNFANLVRMSTLEGVHRSVFAAKIGFSERMALISAKDTVLVQ